MEFHHSNALSFLCCEETIDCSLFSAPPHLHRFHHSIMCPLPTPPVSAIAFSGDPLPILSADDDDDALTFHNLLQQESSYLPGHHYLPKLRAHQILSQRLISVRGLIKGCKIFGFCPLTAVLAVNYLDRYLSQNMSPTWKPWMFELLSIACLSIAAKMEEVDVPALVDLQVDGLGHLFHGATVQRMELAVMNGLNWRLRSVTPIAFAEKAIGCLEMRPEARNLLSERVSELIIGTLSEVEFLEFPPSVIAAACIQFALLENFPVQTDARLTEWLIKQINSSEEEVKKCGKMVEELVADPAGLPAVVEVGGGGESEDYGGEGRSPASPTGVLPGVEGEGEEEEAEMVVRGMRKRGLEVGEGDGAAAAAAAKRMRGGGAAEVVVEAEMAGAR